MHRKSGSESSVDGQSLIHKGLRSGSLSSERERAGNSFLILTACNGVEGSDFVAPSVDAES